MFWEEREKNVKYRILNVVLTFKKMLQKALFLRNPYQIFQLVNVRVEVILGEFHGVNFLVLHINVIITK